MKQATQRKRYERAPYADTVKRVPRPVKEKVLPIPKKREEIVRDIELRGFHELNSIMFAEAKNLCEKTYDRISRHEVASKLIVHLNKEKEWLVDARFIIGKRTLNAEGKGYKVLLALGDTMKRLKRESESIS